MTTQPINAKSIFPDLPREHPAVDKEGNFTSFWNLGFSSLFQALQQNFKGEGILVPQLTQSQINSIQAIYTPYIGHPLPQNNPAVGSQLFIQDISGQMVFDSTNRVPKMFIITYDTSTPPNVVTAAWKTFTLT
jgi:hypothetical protein